MITIRDVARICKVSTATVSRVINTPEQVSVETREKVLRVIKEYNYVPNQIAKNFSSNITNNIALFIFDIMNPFFTKMIKELNKLAFDHNYSLIICDTNNQREREVKYLEYIISSKFAGLILTEGLSADTLKRLNNSCPVICIDRYVDGKQNFPLVTSANRAGARKAMEYLVTLNHRRIAYVSGIEGIRTSDQRKQGYLDVVKKYNLPVNESYIFTGDFKIESGVKALEYFLSLEEMPTAIFCANDLMAEGVLSRALSLNIKVPMDLSVFGFDGVSNNSYWKLTTIEQSISEICEVTMKELLKMITNNSPNRGKIIEIPGKLIIGDTCRKN